MKKTTNELTSIIKLPLIILLFFTACTEDAACAQNDQERNNDQSNPNLDPKETLVDELVKLINNGKAGDTILIPAGTYELKSYQQLVPKQGMVIQGAGIDETIIKADKAWSPGLDGLPADEVNSARANTKPYLFKIENTSDIKIMDMTLTGAKLHGAIFAQKSQNLEFSNLKIRNFIWASILTYDITGFKIHDCLFHDAGGKVKWMGAAIFSNRTINGEFYNNKITTNPNNENRFVGFKARGSDHVRIHHNTVNLAFKGFSLEYMHASNSYIEIDHNSFNGVMSMPGSNADTDDPDFYSFYIHHNYLTRSYAIEGPRSYLIVENNFFEFETDDPGGNLFTDHSNHTILRNIRIHNNQISNVGRGIYWSKGCPSVNVSIKNNHLKSVPTDPVMDFGFFQFSSGTNFTSIDIKDNIVECSADLPRPLLRNDLDEYPNIENNKLVNVSDISFYENTQTAGVQGLKEPLKFKCGYKNEFLVEGWELKNNL